MSKDLADLFILQGVLPAERILGLEDRDSSSSTFGCFDRCYWNYKVIDYPSGWFAAGAYYLALLSKISGSKYYNNAAIKDWAWGGVLFLEKTLNADGSIPEVYPYERSYCATAFMAHYVSNAAKILNKPLPNRFSRTLQWLLKNNTSDVSNQIAAALTAIVELSDCFKQEIDSRFTKLLNALLSSQIQDGYFPEYGGPDLGYNTVTLGMLSRIQKRDNRIPDQIDKGIRWVKGLVDSEAGFNCNTFTRKTQFIYPYAFAMRGDMDMLRSISSGIKAGKVLLPNWLDDRYVAGLAIDYLETGLELLNVNDTVKASYFKDI